MKMCECWLKCHILFNEQAEVLFDESDFAPVSYLNEPISISSFVTDTSWIFNYQCTYLNIRFFVSSIWWCLQSLEKFKIVWVFQFLLKSWIFKWNVWEILMAGSVTLHRHLSKMFEGLWFILQSSSEFPKFVLLERALSILYSAFTSPRMFYLNCWKMTKCEWYPKKVVDAKQKAPFYSSFWRTLAFTLSHYLKLFLPFQFTRWTP